MRNLSIRFVIIKISHPKKDEFNNICINGCLIWADVFPFIVYLTWHIDWHLAKLWPLIFSLNFMLGISLIYAHNFFCESCRLSLILDHCKHNLDPLSHKSSSFFCYSGTPAIANWLVNILLSLGTSLFISLEGTVSKQLS